MAIGSGRWASHEGFAFRLRAPGFGWGGFKDRGDGRLLQNALGEAYNSAAGGKLMRLPRIEHDLDEALAPTLPDAGAPCRDIPSSAEKRS